MPSLESAEEPPCRLLQLPTEILLGIFDEIRAPTRSSPDFHPLTYASFFALRWTCRSLYTIVPDPALYAAGATARGHTGAAARSCRKANDWLDQLVLLECWPEYSRTPPLLRSGAPDSLTDPLDASTTNNTVNGCQPLAHPPWASKIAPESRHACSTCFLLLPSSAFAVSQISSQRAKRTGPSRLSSVLSGGHADDSHVGSKARMRFCIRCGIASQQYTDRTPVMRVVEDWDGRGAYATGFVCRRCNKFVRAPADSAATLRRKCDACRSYRPP